MLRLRARDGTPLSSQVTDADPLRPDAAVRAVQAFAEAPDPPAAERTARVLNAWMLESRIRLAGRALDMAVVKWAGAAASIPGFTLRTGLRGATLARGVLYAGLAAAIGLDAPGGDDSDDLAADLRQDLGTALDLLATGYEFVHVHSAWPDRAGHRKSPSRKREVVELLDAAFSPNLSTLLGAGHVVCVAADHQTPSSGPLYHSGGAVPILVCGAASGTDSVTRFDESACGRGALGHLRGADLMPLLLDCAERSAFLGAERYTAVQCLGTPRDEDVVTLGPTKV
jgi:2,3-bisphosphoglycerate-independent phosphoglycerate mutase